MRNNVLHINLSTGEIFSEELKPENYRGLIGGSGIGWKLMAENLKPGIKALSSENPIVISPGALVGTLAPGASKVGAIYKSPIFASEDGKQFIGESSGGGRYFAPGIRHSGYDHIVISGKAESPVYLWISSHDVRLVDAQSLWGMSTEDTVDAILDEMGKDCGVVSIGPAGENLVRFAMAFIDKTNSLGRSGLGAVMGSKNLKALAVRGTEGIRLDDPNGFIHAAEQKRQNILEWPEREHWINLGMGAGWSTFIHTQYVGKWSKDKWDGLYGEPTRMQTLDRVIGCNSCLLSCRVRWKIPDGEFEGEVGLGSPYGKSATSGQLLDIEDHRRTIHLVTIANAAGIDFYTLTRIIDFVTTLYQRGDLTSEDTSGMVLGRDYQDYLDIIDAIIERKGFGDILADGWIGLSKRLSIDPQQYWYGGITKGVDFIYDGRSSNLHPMMMSFYTRPRPHHGGSHTLTNSPGNTIAALRSQIEQLGLSEDIVSRIFSPGEHTGKFNIGRYTKYMEDWMRVKNATGFCSVYTFFDLLSGEDMAELYSKAEGKEITIAELMEEGERISNIVKCLNAREGFTREDDRIPEPWLRPMNTPEGRIEMKDYFQSQTLTEEDVEKILDDYYEERGWNVKNGNPTKGKLESLGLNRYFQTYTLFNSNQDFGHESRRCR